MKKIIIGPAANYKIGAAVLDRGADELYLGLANWSLRSPCFEMTFDDIYRLHLYAKDHNKKLRVCLNTYPWEHDLSSFDREIEKLIEIGIRSFILADIANIAFIRREYPEVSVHASVACDINNIDDVRVLEEAGASSVTLSFPTPNFVQLIKSVTNLNVIVFAHGYLNYTYRARCYMSSYLRHSYEAKTFDRESSSGSFNREGYCNRACKCHWYLHSNHAQVSDVTMNSYPFVAIDQLEELLKAGVDALKIQGRENSDDLVLEAVSLYKTIIDSFMADPEGFHISSEQKVKAHDIDRRRHIEMRDRTKVMIYEMLGVD